jgi:hypothetical protein
MKIIKLLMINFTLDTSIEIEIQNYDNKGIIKINKSFVLGKI